MRTMIIAALVLSATAANAGNYGATTTCGRYGGTYSCKTEGYHSGPRYYGPRASPITEVGNGAQMTAAELAEQAERIRKWEDFCQPVGTVDSLGVTRLSYKYEGCEFGRSE